jgi:hypothetical protein
MNMLRSITVSALIILAGSLPCAVSAQEVAALSKEELAQVVSGELISLPMPGELFAALGKVSKPDWSAMLRKTPSASFTNRQQIALNLGALIADGYLAVEAKDSQQVKNIAKDIQILAKGLGVQNEILNRGNSIVEFAQNEQWDALKEELEAAQNEVIAAMVAHSDKEYVLLVMLGGWLRGTEVVSNHIALNYSPEGARVLRQPAIVDHFVQKLVQSGCLALSGRSQKTCRTFNLGW